MWLRGKNTQNMSRLREKKNDGDFDYSCDDEMMMMMMMLKRKRRKKNMMIMMIKSLTVKR